MQASNKKEDACMSKKDEAKVAGGVARARALTPEARSRIAKKAAAGRWGLKATHKGNFKDDFGIDVECYVLDDDQHTAVISQRGMGAALGLTGSGKAFTRFVAGNRIAPYLGVEVQEKIENPLKFQWGSGGAEQPRSDLHGYDVTLLIDVCKAIVAAEEKGALRPNQGAIAKQARVILNASAKAGIKGLVYALAGYDATKEQVIAAFKTFVQEEAREYEKEFPAQLYQEWYRLYELPKPERNKPWKFMHLTVDQVYKPLARSNGKILELTKKARKGSPSERHKRLHQFLSEIGVKVLRTHLGQLLGIAQVSASKEQYEKNVNKVFGAQQELDL